MKIKKGQMSLEMIIGLVILLVVATVTVTMFLDIFTFDEGLGDMSMTEIENQCEDHCQSFQRASGDDHYRRALDYCTATFVHDSDESGVVEGQIYEQEYNSYCQDGVKCFNVHQCYKDGIGTQELDAEGCVDLMCDYIDNNIDRYDQADAGAVIEKYFSDEEPGEGVGTCDLSTVDVGGIDVTTWYGELIDVNVEEICD